MREERDGKCNEGKDRAYWVQNEHNTKALQRDIKDIGLPNERENAVVDIVAQLRLGAFAAVPKERWDI